MKKFITVFVEGKKPVKVLITESTTVYDVLDELKISTKSISTKMVSSDKIKPSKYISYEDKLITQVRISSYPVIKDEFKLLNSVLWIGFSPKKNEIKYGYRWVGNEKPTMTKEAFYEEFNKLARYISATNSYEIRGIKAKTPMELSKLYQESKDLILT